MENQTLHQLFFIGVHSALALNIIPTVVKPNYQWLKLNHCYHKANQYQPKKTEVTNTIGIKHIPSVVKLKHQTKWLNY